MTEFIAKPVALVRRNKKKAAVGAAGGLSLAGILTIVQPMISAHKSDAARDWRFVAEMESRISALERWTNSVRSHP